MAITYPLTMPTVTGMARISLRAINGTLLTRSPFTYKEQVQTFGAQRWEADISLPPMKRAAAETWIAWLMSLKGQRGTFYLSDPTAYTPRGSARDTNTIEVFNNGTTIVPANDTIYFDTDQNNVTGYLKAGDYIQLGTGADGTQHLHKVLQDVNTDENGGCEVVIWPNIRRAAHKTDDYADIKVQNTAGIFRLNSSETTWDINQAQTYGLNFTAVENIITDISGEIAQ